MDLVGDDAEQVHEEPDAELLMLAEEVLDRLRRQRPHRRARR